MDEDWYRREWLKLSESMQKAKDALKPPFVMPVSYSDVPTYEPLKCIIVEEAAFNRLRAAAKIILDAEI